MNEAISASVDRKISDREFVGILAAISATTALAPLLGAGVLTIGSWRLVLAVPLLVILALSLWLVRLPESLPPERRQPLTLARTRRAMTAVVSTRLTIGSALAVMFDFGGFAAFLASSQLLFDDV